MQQLEKKLASLSSSRMGAGEASQRQAEQLRAALVSKEAAIAKLREELGRKEVAVLEGQRRLRMVESVMQRLAARHHH